MIFNDMLLYRSSVTDEVIVTITGRTVTAVYDGENHSANGYTVSINNSDYTEADFVFSGAGTATRKDAGITAMGLDASQFANTNDTFKNVTFVVASDGYVEITPRPVSVSIVGASSSYVYDGISNSNCTNRVICITAFGRKKLESGLGRLREFKTRSYDISDNGS